MTLDLSNIQGNILPGFSKDHQAFVLVGFPDGQSGRGWLAGVQPEIASAAEVMAFKDLFEAIRKRRAAQGWRSPAPDSQEEDRDAGALRTVSACWVNVGLSYRGLQALAGAANVTRFPVAFRSNAPGASPWEGPSDVHALLILAADWADDLDNELHRQRQRFAASNVSELALFRGDSLTGEMRGREQFGFKDGISQPQVVGTDYGRGPPVAAGEFILGQADQEGQTNTAGLPKWSRDGSYLVFLQLEQHVQAFRAEMHQAAQSLGLSTDAVKAGVVGRTPDGSLVDPPSRISHTSRGFPHWLPPTEAARHRLIRRAIPYGPRLADGERDEAERGLLFVSYQADIARQFEHVWSQWLNGANFPTPGVGTEALVGQSGSADLAPRPANTGARPSWPSAIRRAASVSPAGQQGGVFSLSLPAFVTVRYGGYFFAPGIGALGDLAIGGGAPAAYANTRK